MSHKILIADDDPVVRHILSMILEGLGHTVTTVETGKACIDFISTCAAQNDLPALVFLDHLLPDINGLEVLIRIKQLSSAEQPLPVVMLSANTEEEILLDVISDQMPDRFLEKPFTARAVATVIDALLGSS